MKKLYFILLPLLIIMLSAVYTNAVHSDNINATKLPCSDCHLCRTPTVEEPCLKSCLYTHEKLTKMVTAVKSPTKILMGRVLSDFGPVPFNHEAHANMQEMNGGCTSCHHYNAVDSIQPCRDCHSDPKSLGQPSLKGIYHRQCLGCHQNWSHTNNCSKCHIGSVETIDGEVSSAVWKEVKENKKIILPAKQVYEVQNSPGTKVTFYHDEHSDKFGLNCNNCHKNEECGFCHDRNQATTHKKSEKEVHALCDDCHQNDNCDKCHGSQEKLRFSHNTAHWRLGVYHKDLECSACHFTGKRISRLKSDCNSCHSDWNSENFNHSSTGFVLDEIHSDLDCEDCHINRKFHDGPDCMSCHDDGRSVNTNPPGVRQAITISQINSERVK